MPTTHHQSRPTRAQNRPKGARGASLPRIHGDCMKLLNLLIDSMKSWPREFKYVFGERLLLGASMMAGRAEKAYRAPDKTEKRRHLLDFEAEFIHVKNIAAIAATRRWIQGPGRAAEVIERIASVETQAEAWLASVAAACADTPSPERGGQG